MKQNFLRTKAMMLAAAIALVVTTANPARADQLANLKAIVLDACTQRPIANATVFALLNDGITGVGTTTNSRGAAGSMALSVDFAPFTIYAKTERQGFESRGEYTISAPVAGATYTRKFYLNPTNKRCSK